MTAGVPGVVGVVGLGRMGLPVARNLLAAGVEVHAWDMDVSQAVDLFDAGAVGAASAAEIGQAATVVLTVLPDLSQVRDVCEGPNGILSAAAPGTIVVVMGTVDPFAVKDYAASLENRGFGLVDAPMSGGVEGANAGTLSIMVGGRDEHVAVVLPVLEKVSTTLRHLGPVGSGELSKACNQIVVGGTLAVLSEAIVLGQRGGIAPQTLLEVLDGGLAASQLLTNKWRNFVDHEFTATGPAWFQHKDLGFALCAGRVEGVAMPVTAVVDQIFGAMRWRGLGGEDHSGVVQVIEALSGIAASD